MKKLILPAIAIIMAFATSAFTAKKTVSNFYLYTSSSTNPDDVGNIANYESSESIPCGGADDVCGVWLTTAKADGQAPESTEFALQSQALEDSQSNHAAANGDIEMKN